jgi:hypothetical protein
MWIRLFVVMALTAGAARAETSDARLRYAIGTICENTQAVSIVKDYLISDALVVVRQVVYPPTGDLMLLTLMNIHRPAKISISYDSTKKGAWFQTTCEGEEEGSHAKLKVHVAGLAFESLKHEWKMEVLTFGVSLPDAKLVERALKENLTLATVPDKPAIEGDDEIGAVVAGWFSDNKIAAAAATNALAAGTAADEVGGAKLATQWEKLKLVPVKVEATKINANYARAHALVAWKYKDKYLVLTLTVIAVHEGDTWKWAVLDFEA